jgi:cysteine synthase A
VRDPDWFVIGAGTGGTSATIGRHLRFADSKARVCVTDPVGSVFAEAHRTGRRDLVSTGSQIEGIGRPRVEPSFVPEVIDRMLTISNAATIDGMHRLSARLGQRVGPSTGTAMAGVLMLADELVAEGRSAALATVVCDDGDRYRDTYYDADWVARHLGVDSTSTGQHLVGRS